MPKQLSPIQRAYLAGFLDGDGSIYVRLKPNTDYRFGFQIAPAVILFQSSKDRHVFERICAKIRLGYIRERNDGILEYTINKQDSIRAFLGMVGPYVVMKVRQTKLMLRILRMKTKVKNRKDFQALMDLIDQFRKLNYSKKRKKHTLTP